MLVFITKMKLTNNDKKTLMLLLEDGRMTDTAIAKKLGITKQAVGRIRKKMKKKGIIRRYTTQLDYERLGVHTFAIVLASLTDKWLKKGELEATEQLVKDPNIIRVFRVSRGEISHIIVYAFKNLAELENYFQRPLQNGLVIKQIHTCSHLGMSKDENKELFEKILSEPLEGKTPEEVLSAIDKFKKSLS